MFKILVFLRTVLLLFSQSITFSACRICRIAVEHVLWKTGRYFSEGLRILGFISVWFHLKKKKKEGFSRTVVVPSYEDLECCDLGSYHWNIILVAVKIHLKPYFSNSVREPRCGSIIFHRILFLPHGHSLVPILQQILLFWTGWISKRFTWRINNLLMGILMAQPGP